MNPVVNQAENMNPILRAFAEGGFVMYVILVIGAVALALIISRFMALKSLRIDKKEFSDQVFRMILGGDLRQAISYCDSKQAPLSNTVKSGLVQVMNKRPDEEVQVAMDAAVLREMPKLEGLTSFLAVLGNIAVLAGLLGTILGMIGSFRAVSTADPATKAQLLSEGIAHALNCTAFGLIVAVTAILFYGLFQHMIQKSENEMLETSMTLMNLVASNRDKLRD
ncbi:MAG: adventurous gliding motility protein [Pseudobdellovibrio sp.]|nr:adventurous gliding motility protein [Pseudobdellovibrio sp.]